MDRATLGSSLQRWRMHIDSDVSLGNGRSDLAHAAQVTLSRLVVLRLLECWGIEPDGSLARFGTVSDVYPQFEVYLSEVSDRYALPFLHPAWNELEPEPIHAPPMLFLSTEGFQEILSDLYQSIWTEALRTHPATVLELLWSDRPSLPSEQTSAPPSRQKSYGAYYTPADITHQMVDDALHAYRQHHLFTSSFCVLDPACGFGAFLITVCEWWMAYLDGKESLGFRSRLGITNWRNPETLSFALSPLYGVDLDPDAVEMTKLLLVLTVLRHGNPPWNDRRAIAQTLFTKLNQRIRWGNAIVAPDIEETQSLSRKDRTRLRPFDWHHEFPAVMTSGGFDVVIGNPPYLDSEWMAHHMAIERRYCATHYQSAVGNWDLFCIFIEQAFNLCKPGGFTSLIVPNKLQSVPYAARTRQILAHDHTLLHLRDYSQESCFPVAVYPIVYLAQKRPPQPSQAIQYYRMGTREDHAQYAIPYHRFLRSTCQTWCTSQPRLMRLLERMEEQSSPLGAIASVLGAATVAEAYDIQPLLRDDAHADLQSSWRVVNSGTIDRYRMLWGQKPLRYLKHTYLHPVILHAQQTCLSPTRQQQANHPKIIVASMTQVLECVADVQGNILAGKSTSIVQSAIALPYLLAILNSKLMSLYYRWIFGGHALHGGYLRVGTAQLRSLPIRLPTEDWESDFIQSGIRNVECLLSEERAIARADLNQAIDQWVYQLYDFSKGEIEYLQENSC
ncbi:MAG: Eco57I restriction-modification methylase domain-containing protein [Synechococcales cyanobacterium T60_A2020_003]|nr:Eco57I restriction-modification methylase domain-containing protein [Synechococcales cyanobacterium T60_A2020_003]